MTLSPRQREVLAALAAGKHLKHFAQNAGISYGTAKNHSEAAQRKLGARSKTHAVALAIRTGEIA